jgi:hypothetical protein
VTESRRHDGRRQDGASTLPSTSAIIGCLMAVVPHAGTARPERQRSHRDESERGGDTRERPACAFRIITTPARIERQSHGADGLRLQRR